VNETPVVCSIHHTHWLCITDIAMPTLGIVLLDNWCPLQEVTLHYNSADRSKGVAVAHFERKGDNAKAFQQYNNQLIYWS
jgi:hypothetical protein